jgi:hypothetical protein
MVVSETLNGEAIIMHHGTGHYFNAQGSGAIIWEAVEQGATLNSIATRLQTACGLTPAEALGATKGFLDTLAAYELVKTGDAAPGILPPPSAIAFATPELGVHKDLMDMLLLDPVHDIDEAGWPAPGHAVQRSGAPWSG